MTSILTALLTPDEPDDDNAAPADPAELLAQADVQLSDLERVFRARGDTAYLDRVAELKQILRRMRSSTRTTAQ